MPDGEYLPPFDFNCVERHLSEKIRAHYGNRYVVQGRWAHLSKPKEIHFQQGRGRCQARNLHAWMSVRRLLQLERLHPSLDGENRKPHDLR